ncbi:Putative signal peptide peptidase SppA [Planctomycetes bacterium Pan216]|uniref:Signal peptide peptidase SppA n=1 Tax=Kolteria novifilia TaxID=2527975 RepID=A0A518B2M3_9BACT|nr:Putative signal peptide peptidase SppA [Planctomycetes bacterium Pan216]
MTARRINKIANAFYSTPLAILPEKAADIETLIEARQEGVFFTQDEVAAFIGGPTESHEIVMHGNVAVVSVFGVIEKRMNLFVEISGGTSTELLVRDIEALANDDSVSAIVLDVDSPGGSVNGPSELSHVIVEARNKKRIVAVANDLAASAAYWIASAASEVVTTDSASVGSIGVFAVFREHSQAEAERGIKTTIVQAGDMKTAGHRSKAMTDDERAMLQERVDSFHEMFMAAVAENRGMSMSAVRSVADGRVYVGQQAVEAGLADRVGTLSQVIEELSSRTSRPGGARVRVEGMQMTKQEAETTTEVETVDMEAVATKARQEERERVTEIEAMVKVHGPRIGDADKLKEELVSSGASLDSARARVLKALTESETAAPRGSFEVGPSSNEKFYETVSDGLAFRVGGSEAAASNFARDSTGRLKLCNYERVYDRGHPAGIRFTGQARKIHPDANIFRGMRLIDIAAECLNREGISTRGMDPTPLAKLALGWEFEGVPKAGALGGGGFHTTGSFPELLRDAANKTLLMAYAEAPSTWRQWVHQAESVSDFKNIHRVRLSGVSDLEVIPEDKAFPEDELKDSGEDYAVETRGKAYSFTRQMLINDDLGAFTTLTIRQTRAAERTINRAVYAVLTGNPTMRDNTTLFHANHNNIVDTTGAPSVAQLNEMKRLIRLQTDPNKPEIILNHEMRFLLVPAALEGVTLELLNSVSNPEGTNSGVANIWRNRVTPVVEGQLDLNDPVAYYGLGAWQDADHIEVSFLRGEESPILEDEFDFDKKGRKFTIHQTFGVKAIDWVNIVYNDGTSAG